MELEEEEKGAEEDSKELKEAVNSGGKLAEPNPYPADAPMNP